MGLDFCSVKKSLKKFTSVSRRSEYMGKIKGVKIYGDYAHHPKEIKATLSAYGVKGNKDLIIFQPHTFSRTRILMQDFVDVLKDFERVVLYKTYPAREIYDYSGSETKLCVNLAKNSKFSPTLCMNEKELFAILSKEKGVKRVFVLGAGDLYDIFKKLLPKKIIK